MITVVNYGLSNLLSVERSIKLFGEEVNITGDYKEVLKSKKVVLPGVGAFQDGMKQLKKLHLDEAIIEISQKDIPLLGICLGMQMLFDESDENGLCKGLGIIKGRVERIPALDINENKQLVPHIGWERIMPEQGEEHFKSEIFCDSIIGEEMYFVHSYEGKPQDKCNILANAIYGGRNICAAVIKDNVIGCQFHPEKSGMQGLKIVKNFVEW